MLNKLRLKNVGPAPEMALDFGPRLNLLTGDNGLGKSFLLDIAWWAVTRKWPADLNNKLAAGLMAKPITDEEATIKFAFTSKSSVEEYESKFDRYEQAWTGRPGRPANPGLVLYAQADGGFAIWDPSRNYWKRRGDIDVQDRPPGYVFSFSEVWDGLKDEDGKMLCNGLISDWAGWQKEKGSRFKNFSAVLKSLSPSKDEEIKAGPLTRISLDDARDIPTLKMPYGQDVPVLHASAGMRRILALAYLLVWAWEEHLQASKLINVGNTDQIIFLIDELESHLHPKWQRRIVRVLLDVMKKLTRTAEVQIVAATHSPLVMSSVEPYFDEQKDAWFDLDLKCTEEGNAQVELVKKVFEPHGDVSNWLTSEAFDLTDTIAPEWEELLSEASELLDKQGVTADEVEKMQIRLVKALNPKDPFLFRWRAICQKKGLLK